VCEPLATGTEEEQDLFAKFFILEHSIYQNTIKPSLELRKPLETPPVDKQPSAQEQRKLAYDKYRAKPTEVTLEEFALVKQYLYENDMMTRAEEKDFEAELFLNKP
jgi:hypothetical protein